MPPANRYILPGHIAPGQTPSKMIVNAAFEVGSSRCDDQRRVQRCNAFVGNARQQERVPALHGPGSSQRDDPTDLDAFALELRMACGELCFICMAVV